MSNEKAPDGAAEGDKKNAGSLSPSQQYPKLKATIDQWTHCADCNDPDPQWAEIRRGILICLQCSGVHRQFGTHISQIRSLTLDKWTEAMVDAMCSCNEEFNNIWEYHVDPAVLKPTARTNRKMRSQYINLKYWERRFHEDHHKRLAPVFASSDYDESDDSKDPAQNSGMVEYSGVIRIYVLNATELPKADVLSQSDPYVVFRNQNGQSARSKTIKKKKNPVWNELLILSVNENEPITISIFDEDGLSADDLLCSASLDIGLKCKDGDEVKFENFAMTVDDRWKKQKKKSLFSFSVVYDKLK